MNQPRRSWAGAGTRPVAPKQVVRESFYVYAAVAPSLGKMTSLLLPYSDTEMMQLFLNQVSEDFKDYFIVMQIDRAGWHMSENLKVPENIRLLPQPPYSPELNPAEHLWEFIKENFLHNRLWKALDEVEDVVVDSLRALAANPELLKSMTWFPHLRINL